MSNSYRHIIFILLNLLLLNFFFSSSAYAFEVFFDPIYWKATETVDWVLINNRNPTHQEITYKTVNFDYKPGCRVGIGLEGIWNTKLYYTGYHTKARDRAYGNLVSTFLGGKLVQGNNFFFHSGQVHFKLDYHIVDWDISKNICLTDSLELNPIIGVRGGKIKQSVITKFQGQISITEAVKNNFNGIGPKMGIESKWALCKTDNSQFSLVSDFTTSYLWGRWAINDITLANNSTSIHTIVGKRRFGAFTVQGLIGVKLEYKYLSAKLGYEFGDWFNQYQVLDDGTGTHNNDLVLQGITLRLSLDF